MADTTVGGTVSDVGDGHGDRGGRLEIARRVARDGGQRVSTARHAAGIPGQRVWGRQILCADVRRRPAANRTPATATLSAAVAVSVTEPAIEAPAAGLVMETVGFVVSVGSTGVIMSCWTCASVNAPL